MHRISILPLLLRAYTSKVLAGQASNMYQKYYRPMDNSFAIIEKHEKAKHAELIKAQRQKAKEAKRACKERAKKRKQDQQDREARDTELIGKDLDPAIAELTKKLLKDFMEKLVSVTATYFSSTEETPTEEDVYRVELRIVGRHILNLPSYDPKHVPCEEHLSMEQAEDLFAHRLPYGTEVTPPFLEAWRIAFNRIVDHLPCFGTHRPDESIEHTAAILDTKERRMICCVSDGVYQVYFDFKSGRVFVSESPPPDSAEEIEKIENVFSSNSALRRLTTPFSFNKQQAANLGEQEELMGRLSKWAAGDKDTFYQIDVTKHRLEYTKQKLEEHRESEAVLGARLDQLQKRWD